MLCMLAFYRVVKYYNSKDIKPVVVDSTNLADESESSDGEGDGEGEEEATKYNFCCVSGHYRAWYAGEDKEECPSGMYMSSLDVDDCESDEPACFANRDYLSIATDARWDYWDEVPSSYTEISGITRSSDCVTLDPLPTICKPQSIPATSKSQSTGDCEDSVAIEINDGIDCGGDSFYSINCTTSSDVSFDSSERNILAGLGVKYGVNISTIRSCKATFNGETWKNTYDSVEKNKKRACSDLSSAGYSCDNIEYAASRARGDARDIVSVIYDRLNIQEDLKDMVESYIKYDPNMQFNQSVSATISKANVGASFEPTILGEGTGTYLRRKTVRLGVAGVQNPYNYTWSNEYCPYVVRFIPPTTMIDGLDGGHKLYLDYYIKPGTYNTSISVSGNNFSVSNDKCDINVADHKIVYRPIDTSNPFIDNSWTPGKNWYNSSFDFRNIIH